MHGFGSVGDSYVGGMGGSYVPPVVGGFAGGALGPSFVPPPAAPLSLGAGPDNVGLQSFGFGAHVQDLPGRIFEAKERAQGNIQTRAQQAREITGAQCTARHNCIDRQADTLIMTTTNQANARRQAAKLQAHNAHQQQQAMIDRNQMAALTEVEQKAQAAANRAQQQINQAQMQAEHYRNICCSMLQQQANMAGHAAQMAGAGYGLGYGSGGFGGGFGMGGYGGLGGYGGMGYGGMGGYGFSGF